MWKSICLYLLVLLMGSVCLVEQGYAEEEKPSSSSNSTNEYGINHEKLEQALSNLAYKDTTEFSVEEFITVGNEGNLVLASDDQGESTNILDKVLNLMTATVGTVGVLLMIVAGYYMIGSQGDETNIQKGKNIFFYTIIGLIVVFLSYAIIQFIIAMLFQ